jgi:hypothetical protein
VSTVDELVNQLQQVSGLSPREIQTILFKGKVLERKALLRQLGVQDGANVIVVTENYQMKGKEVLALFLEMITEENWENFQSKWRSHQQLNNPDSSFRAAFAEQWKEARLLQRHHVSDFIRNSLDLSYHTLRASWEHPTFRRSLSDPMRIEAYRKVVANHLSKRILSDIPGAKFLVEHPDAWKNQMLQLTTGILRLGDVILDGVLDILLDVLKGAGNSSKRDGSAAGYYRDGYAFPDATLDDPSEANNLLYELSESEDGE